MPFLCLNINVITMQTHCFYLIIALHLFCNNKQCYYEMKNLRLKRKITPFNCDKSNDFQEYKYCIFNKRTSPINEKKNYHKKNTNNLHSTITLFLSTQHIFNPTTRLTPSTNNTLSAPSTQYHFYLSQCKSRSKRK